MTIAYPQIKWRCIAGKINKDQQTKWAFYRIYNHLEIEALKGNQHTDWEYPLWRTISHHPSITTFTHDESWITIIHHPLWTPKALTRRWCRSWSSAARVMDSTWVWCAWSCQAGDGPWIPWGSHGDPVWGRWLWVVVFLAKDGDVSGRDGWFENFRAGKWVRVIWEFQS